MLRKKHNKSKATFDYCFSVDFLYSEKNSGFCSDEDSVARLWCQVPLSMWNTKCCASERQIYQCIRRNDI